MQIEFIIKLYHQNYFRRAMGCGTSQQSISNISLPRKDQYDRKQLIGVGNHGRVYRSIHLGNQRQFAIKVVDQFKDMNPSFAWGERLQLLERLKKLKNEAITPYLEMEFKDKELSIVMEIAKEGSLKKFLQKRGKLTEELASKMTEQILQGVYYLHSASVLHKDLKSSNVLVFTEKNVKISDYAIAEIYDQRLSVKKEKRSRAAEADFSRGESLPYMAPEVIKGEGITEKSDVWSIGCIVIEMLTGKVPWSDLNQKFELAFAEITKRSCAPLPNSTQECKDFLQKCLAILPSKRATVSELLKHPFIRSYSSKPREEVEIDRVKLSLQKNDAANRISSRNSNKRDQNEEIFKTPPSIEKSIKNQNNSASSNRSKEKIKADTAHKYMSEQRQPYANGEQLKKLKEAVNNFGKIKKSRDIKAIYNDDILPEILEDEEDMVMLNNKKVKLKNAAQKIKTEQTDSSDKREYRNSIQLAQNHSYFSINSKGRVNSKQNSNFNDSFEREDSSSKMKLQTQPNLMTSQFEKNHEYFKKPLKLLKKKLKERQQKYISNFSTSIDNESNAPKEEPEGEEEEENTVPYASSKIRTVSEKSREETAINTQLAKAERDRYINEQLILKRQKEKEKVKWQQELKKESEVIKKQFSHRYAYQRFHPLLI